VKQVLIQGGRAVVDEVPAPVVEPGTVLVRLDHSCISVGTETSGIRASAVPLWKRAVQQPDKLRKVLQAAATQGVTTTLREIQHKLATGEPTGYSAAGTVIDIGAGIDDLRPGERVACAGSQCAHHAEIVRIPRNLAAPLPGDLGFAEASTVTLGAIALQGVRRAEPTLGETFVVIGLGVLGQLTAQLLRAHGCRVIGSDLDPSRIHVALELGMNVGINPDQGDDVEQVARLTGGMGADGVIIAAASPSDAVVSSAFRMCRRKGRVVVVGDVGLNLDRSDLYAKELDFFISTSYGPGRYDPRYEERGIDYPVAYVRWTENRNMQEYLRLLAEHRVRVGPLITATYPIAQAGEAYQALERDGAKPLIVLLSYDGDGSAVDSRKMLNPRARSPKAGRVGVAVVGAGAFAKGVHLPNLQRLGDEFELRAVVSRTGHNASATARQFGAAYSTTEYQQVLADPDVHLVVITTRHNLHGGQALEALRAGKHVLVEKPLALSQTELDDIVRFFDGRSEEAVTPVLLTGFNRRFSAYARRVSELVKQRSNPMILNYRMNAGYLPLDHWVHTSEGGGRNKGEACHIYDLFTYLTASRVMMVQASTVVPRTAYYSSSDNFVATISLEDGSLATLTYTALGVREYPKEQLEIFVDGKVIVLDDYRKLTVYGARAKGRASSTPEKGQKEELEALARAIRGGGEWPIPLWQQVQATEIALRVEECIAGAAPYCGAHDAQ
jgi:predicted dehydrogenase/threonine dehydrogenase-like Zn-dependent dehydrogenase